MKQDCAGRSLRVGMELVPGRAGHVIVVDGLNPLRWHYELAESANSRTEMTFVQYVATRPDYGEQ